MFTKLKGWKAILRDVILLWISTFMGGFIIAIIHSRSGSSELPLSAIGITNMIFGSFAFCISGCLTPEQRWQHLSKVAFFVWLTSIINVLIGPFNIVNWIFSIIIVFIMMLIGGGISFLFVKPQDNSTQTIEKSCCDNTKESCCSESKSSES